MAEQLMLVENLLDNLLRAADSQCIDRGDEAPEIAARHPVFLARLRADGVAVAVIVRVVFIDRLL
ncbi:hypothetical protein D3C72_2218470 [compost metagenome]